MYLCETVEPSVQQCTGVLGLPQMGAWIGVTMCTCHKKAAHEFELVGIQIVGVGGYVSTRYNAPELAGS